MYKGKKEYVIYSYNYLVFLLNNWWGEGNKKIYTYNYL